MICDNRNNGNRAKPVDIRTIVGRLAQKAGFFVDGQFEASGWVVVLRILTHHLWRFLRLNLV
jgi:hypothetical protein